MAVGLRFTDGTTTVTVSNGTTGILETYRQDNQPYDVETVTDQASILLLGTLSTVRGVVRSLNRLFWQAQERKRSGMGARVFVERDLGDSVWWRSEIIEAVLINRDETLDTGLAGEKIPFGVSITRYNWWEGAQADVPLTNANGTDNTSGLTVYNHDDAGTGHDNFVTIDGVNDIDGDIPTPAILSVYKSATTSGSYIHELWVGHQWYDTALAHILEFEDGSYGSDTADAACSGGYRQDYTCNAGTTTVTQRWSIAAAVSNRFAGMYIQPLLRLASTTNVDKLRFRLTIYPTVGGVNPVIYTTDYVQPIAAVNVIELPEIRFPPFLPNQSSYETFYIELQVYNTHTSSVTLPGDFLMLNPLMGWRKFLNFDYAQAAAMTIYDDGIAGEFYLMDGSSLKYQAGNAFGGPIKLVPGKDQRVYFLWRAEDDASIGYTVSVSMDYRPRRLTI